MLSLQGGEWEHQARDLCCLNKVVHEQPLIMSPDNHSSPKCLYILHQNVPTSIQVFTIKNKKILVISLRFRFWSFITPILIHRSSI
jgi:hypothetical protein